MISQVSGLRRFLGERTPAPWRAGADPVVVIGSGKGGSGGSTLTALLGLACAACGRRTLLVDTDEHVGTLHRFLGTAAAHGIGAIIRNEVTVTGALVGIDPWLTLLPGGHGEHAPPPELSAHERRALLRRCSAIYHEYDLVLIDAGSRLDGVLAAATAGTRRFVAVAGAAPVSLASAFALVKAIETRWPGAAVDLLVNRHSEAQGREAYLHVNTACERFLARGISLAGILPDDGELAAASLAGQPVNDFATGKHTNHHTDDAVHAIAERLLSGLEEWSPRVVRSSDALTETLHT
jgi:flagellar biosynthesis protein FlhG